MLKKVIIADCNELSLMALSTLVKSHSSLELIGIADTNRELFTLVKNNPSALVIIDFNIDKLTLPFVAKIISKYQDINILPILHSPNKSLINSALDIGVSGCLTKNCSIDEINEAIAITIKGKAFFCERILNLLECNTKSTELKQVVT